LGHDAAATIVDDASPEMSLPDLAAGAALDVVPRVLVRLPQHLASPLSFGLYLASALTPLSMGCADLLVPDVVDVADENGAFGATRRRFRV
jgi:hypothetical protein